MADQTPEQLPKATWLTKLGSHLRKTWGDYVLLGFLLFLFVSIWVHVATVRPPNPSWIMVYLTGIYAIVNIYLAVAALKSSNSAERSVSIMEQSLAEQHRTRWAQFAPYLGFPYGYIYNKLAEDECEVILSNLFSQPIINLRVLLWFTELNSSGQPEIRYSSMLSGFPGDIPDVEKNIRVHLRKSELTEAECRNYGELALQRFQEVTDGRKPQGALCAIIYSHRANLEGSILVYDLVESEKLS